MEIRDRIKSFSRIKASELKPHPNNWRVHPQSQRDAMAGILGEVGYVDALVVRKHDGGYQILDGHLRAETTPDTEVPVLIVDLDDAEAAKVLAIFDPVGAMAETDEGRLNSLLSQIETQDGALAMLLSGLGKAVADEISNEPIGQFENTVYPIAAVPGEKYEYVVILCKDESDFAALRTILELRIERSYGTGFVALGHVVTFGRFYDAIKRYCSVALTTSAGAGESSNRA